MHACFMLSYCYHTPHSLFPEIKISGQVCKKCPSTRIRIHAELREGLEAKPKKVPIGVNSNSPSVASCVSIVSFVCVFVILTLETLFRAKQKNHGGPCGARARPMLLFLPVYTPERFRG